jgi:hypothetical protein
MKKPKNNQIAPAKVKILPFSRMVWRDGYQDKDQILQRWAEEFNRAELSTVLDGLRDCGIYLMESAKYQEECLNFNKKGLVFLPVLKNDPSPGGQLPSSSQRSPFIQCVVSYSEDKAQQLLGCLQSGEGDCPAEIGKLLGYPQCCVNFLKKYSSSKKMFDPIFIAAKNTKGAVFDRERGRDGKGVPGKVEAETVHVDIPPETNIILRNFGIKTIPHIPCSFNCEKSRELAEKFLKFMPSRNSLLEFLGKSMIWDEYKGIAVINTRWFKGATQSIFHDDQTHHIIDINIKKSKSSRIND